MAREELGKARERRKESGRGGLRLCSYQTLLSSGRNFFSDVMRVTRSVFK